MVNVRAPSDALAPQVFVFPAPEHASTPTLAGAAAAVAAAAAAAADAATAAGVVAPAAVFAQQLAALATWLEPELVLASAALADANVQHELSVLPP